MSQMPKRLLLLAMCFLIAAVYASRAMRAEAVALREPLAGLPRTLGEWQGVEDQPFPANILRVLGVDEYISRTYTTPGAPPVSLYIGYYQSQREGDTMHSPMNCLPGSGWQPVERDRITLSSGPGTAAVSVNRLLIEKGLDRSAVLYWYQSHGRVVAGEYASKVYLIYDALRMNRSDGAMVRVITPILPGESSSQGADHRAATFAARLLPHLEKHLP